MARPLTWDFLLLTLLLAGLAYVAVDALWRETGFSEEAQLLQERSLKRARLNELVSQRDALEAKVEALAGREVDLDLLEEQARAKLGVGREDEVLLQEPEGGLR